MIQHELESDSIRGLASIAVQRLRRANPSAMKASVQALTHSIVEFTVVNLNHQETIQVSFENRSLKHL